jgi:hypothetical protein
MLPSSIATIEANAFYRVNEDVEELPFDNAAAMAAYDQAMTLLDLPPDYKAFVDKGLYSFFSWTLVCDADDPETYATPPAVAEWAVPFLDEFEALDPPLTAFKLNQVKWALFAADAAMEWALEHADILPDDIAAQLAVLTPSGAVGPALFAPLFVCEGETVAQLPPIDEMAADAGIEIPEQLDAGPDALLNQIYGIWQKMKLAQAIQNDPAGAAAGAIQNAVEFFQQTISDLKDFLSTLG